MSGLRSGLEFLRWGDNVSNVFRVMRKFTFSILALLIAGSPVAALAQRGLAEAPKMGRFFGKYEGGFSVSTEESSVAGPATVEIRPSRNGRVVRMLWRSTFYDSFGSSVIPNRYTFRRRGRVFAASMDPEKRRFPGSGRHESRRANASFELTGRNPSFSVETSMTRSGPTAIAIAATMHFNGEVLKEITFSGTKRR